MSDINNEVITRLAVIDERLANIQENNNAQWEKISKIDDRLRTAEIKNAGVSATVAGLVAIGISAIKNGFNGH